MHNSYYYILIISVLLKVYVQSLVGIKVDQTIYLINENMIASCVSEKSKIDAYEQGLQAIELNKQILEALVEDTLNDNLSFCEIKVGYFYYDSINSVACSVSGSKCNSVQMQIQIKYNGTYVKRLLRYELSS